MKTKLIVQKYGGATLSDPGKIKQVAKRIAEDASQGTRVVAVVSAMGKTTNQLIELAAQVSTHPNRREMDMLLTTGERISMALVSMALNDLGCKAISFTGSQAGILTDDSHINAFILDVKAFRVDEALLHNKVVVLAGFQGVSPTTKEITTLGRGGSDTTAVAMAAYLKADRCEILKDVEAVCTSDPKIVSGTKTLSELNYDQLCEMTFWGAKVLHYRSAELAKRMRVPLYVGPAATTGQGTIIGERTSIMYEASKILALNSHERILCLDFATANTSQAWTELKNFIDKNELGFPQVLLSEKTEQGVRLYLAGPSEILTTLQAEIQKSKQLQFAKEDLASVTVTCAGSTSPAIMEKILATLQLAGIDVFNTIMSPLSNTVLIRASERQRTLQELHRLIDPS